MCELCVLLLTATSLGRCTCSVTAWGSDHSRRGIVYRNVFWNYCMTMPQNGLACWLAHDYVLQSEMVLTESRLLGHYPSL